EDALLIQHLGIDIHFVKEGNVIGKNSRSNEMFIHDVNVAVARNYSNNLKEEVRKGMLGRAEAGWYPGRAPIGYRSNRLLRTIEIDPVTKPVVYRIFELFGTGTYSLESLRKHIRMEFGKTITKSYLAILLKNRFYIGFFEWQGRQFSGKHRVFIEPELFERVQRVFSN